LSKNFIKEYFNFSSSAKRGIWILIVLIFLIFLVPFLFHLTYIDHSNIPDTLFIKDLDNAFNEIKNQDTIISFHHLNSFDPNIISKEQWIKLGVSEKTAINIVKYVQRGGKFHRKEDLLKIYGFDTTLYKHIFASIIIKKESSLIQYKPLGKKLIIKKPFIIELNSADSLTLEKLPGIGKIMSHRIIKYRNLIGGFYKPEQLLEVYGLNNEIFNSIKNKVWTDSGNIKKIDINLVTQLQMQRHPYIGKYKASVILKYRKFKNTQIYPEELLTDQVLTKEEFEKLRFYLK